jgi:hypothetical protein
MQYWRVVFRQTSTALHYKYVLYKENYSLIVDVSCFVKKITARVDTAFEFCNRPRRK